MINFIKSLEFLITLVVMAILLKIFGLSDLANYVQVFSAFQWSYIIYRLHKHHKLIQSMLEEDDE